jgi:hypothetical protein
MCSLRDRKTEMQRQRQRERERWDRQSESERWVVGSIDGRMKAVRTEVRKEGRTVGRVCRQTGLPGKKKEFGFTVSHDSKF